MDLENIFRDICRGGNLKLAVACGFPIKEALQFCLDSEPEEIVLISALACQLAESSDFETTEGHLMAGCSNPEFLRFFLEFQEWTSELQASWEPSVLKSAMKISLPDLSIFSRKRATHSVVSLIDNDELDVRCLEFLSESKILPTLLLCLNRFLICRRQLPAYFELVAPYFRSLIRPFLHLFCHPDLFIAEEKKEEWPQQRYILNQVVRLVFGENFLEEERINILIGTLQQSSPEIRAYVLGLMPDETDQIPVKLVELEQKGLEEYLKTVQLFVPPEDMRYTENLGMESLDQFHPFDVLVFEGYGYTRDEWIKLIEGERVLTSEDVYEVKGGKCFYTRKELTRDFKMQLANRIAESLTLPPTCPYFQLVREFGFSPLPEFNRPKRLSSRSSSLHSLNSLRSTPRPRGPNRPSNLGSGVPGRTPIRTPEPRLRFPGGIRQTLHELHHPRDQEDRETNDESEATEEDSLRFFFHGSQSPALQVLESDDE